MRRTKKLVYAAVAACGLTLLSIWAISDPLRDALKIQLERVDAASGVTFFTITNRSSRPIKYRFIAEVRLSGRWPRYPEGTPLPYFEGDSSIKPKESTRLAISAPKANDAWRLSIVFRDAEDEPGRMAAWVRDSAKSMNMNWLAARAQTKKGYVVRGPELTK